MRVSSIFASWALISGASALVDIPKVNEVVNQALKDFANYTSYAGPAETPAPQRVQTVAAAAVDDAPYWYAQIRKQGRAAFNNNPAGYQVFRNVKDFGAKGDGVTDDTAAINAAMSSGGRCGPGNCDSSTTTPAVVYFPAGTYIVSSSIIYYYHTNMVGNPNSLPVIKATPGFVGLGLVDGNQYQNTGAQGWISTNVFFRQMRNFVFDLTPIPAASAATGIHWAVSQAVSIQNVEIRMAQASNSQHQGIFIENGSGGWMNDIRINGGLYGLNVGNQQFAMRNIQISNAVVGVSQIWDWGWVYQQFTWTNCGTALAISNGGSGNQNVGSVNVIDSTVINSPIFIDSAWTQNSVPSSAGTLNIENVNLQNVGTGVKSPTGTVLNGGSYTIGAWGQGTRYTPNGPQKLQGAYTPAARPSGLLDGNRYFAKSKPQYASNSVNDFISARDQGARGDGSTDDTTALQNAINTAKSQNKILYIDHGNYKVTRTIYVPAGSRIVGEGFSVIQASGSTFQNVNSPQPILKLGNAGEFGSVEVSDLIISTQGATPGAIMIQWNLAASRGSGLWDVHTRIGGFRGSQQDLAACPRFIAVKEQCKVAYMGMHIAKGSSNAYLENTWFWTSDHDLDEGRSTQITVYAARGMLVEAPNVWLYATGVEHFAIYQYNFVNTRDIFTTFLQTETPYWMPNPDVRGQPFAINQATDPNYSTCQPGNCNSLGLRVANSQNVNIYGAGLYSFFNNYSTDCSTKFTNSDCQSEIFRVEGSSNVRVYALSTIGTVNMIVKDGQSVARYSDNENVFPETVGFFST